MKVTEQQLVSCGVASARAKVYAPIITAHSDAFGITTRMRMSHFLAQVLHESACFRYVRELASGKAYDTGRLAVALGNTPEADGDGQKYKGRGLIQVTGKANYEACSRYFGVDFVSRPEMLEQPEWAFRSAGWFWQEHGLNALADRDELTRITRIINGGLNGRASRLKYLGKAKRAFGLK